MDGWIFTSIIISFRIFSIFVTLFVKVPCLNLNALSMENITIYLYCTMLAYFLFRFSLVLLFLEKNKSGVKKCIIIVGTCNNNNIIHGLLTYIHSYSLTYCLMNILLFILGNDQKLLVIYYCTKPYTSIYYEHQCFIIHSPYSIYTAHLYAYMRVYMYKSYI